MTSEIITMPIADLLQLRKKGILKINSEYQRGPVWNSIQQKKLIDSVLRGIHFQLSIYIKLKQLSGQ